MVDFSIAMLVFGGVCVLYRKTHYFPARQIPMTLKSEYSSEILGWIVNYPVI